MKTWPKISLIIPTINEERNIKNCLDSVFSQDYPKSKLEVIIVDDDSTDKTLDIARQYRIKVLRNGFKHGEIGKMIGFKAAKGKYFMYLDADAELISKDFFKRLVLPLEDDSTIIASFTKEGAGSSSPAIERYLSFDSLQRDGLYQWLTPSVESMITKSFPDYFICEYKIDKIPPSGHCIYRHKELSPLVKDFKMFLELDFLKLLVINDHRQFAFVPQAVLYHHHVASLSELLRKRKYNLTKVYRSHVKNGLYTWVNWKSPFDIFKLGLWVIYANLFIPSLITGIYKSLKYRDWAGLYEPFVNLLVTDTLLLTILWGN